MPTQKADPTFLHTIPKDMNAVLRSDPKLKEKWQKLTPLMKNEWICWVTVFKKAETRENHLRRWYEEVVDGQKRPCCWQGCPHRRESAQKWFRKKK
jgi:uncharacterized protein YdeI (YjbR/CyaY-like superfamily)